jgi:hypothetical protein
MRFEYLYPLIGYYDELQASHFRDLVTPNAVAVASAPGRRTIPRPSRIRPVLQIADIDRLGLPYTNFSMFN